MLSQIVGEKPNRANKDGLNSLFCVMRQGISTEVSSFLPHFYRSVVWLAVVGWRSAPEPQKRSDSSLSWIACCNKELCIFLSSLS